MPEPILQEPAAIFMSISAVLLIAPLLSELVHLPGIVGLILGGLLVGHHGLNLLVTGPTIELFGDVSLIYLMCNAGLDIDLDQFARVRRKAMVLAAISFLLPQLSGIGLGWLMGLGLAAAVVFGGRPASALSCSWQVLRWGSPSQTQISGSHLDRSVMTRDGRNRSYQPGSTWLLEASLDTPPTRRREPPDGPRRRGPSPPHPRARRG